MTVTEKVTAILREADLKRIAELRHALDAIKVRSYELGQRELHDMALSALRKEEG